MLLICDGCLRECTGLYKIPCGYYIMWNDNPVIFMRYTDTPYHNFCLECISVIDEKEHGT